jgi:hypothetical protein
MVYQLLNNPSFENSTTNLNGWALWCSTSCGSTGGKLYTTNNCHLSIGTCFGANCPGSTAIYQLIALMGILDLPWIDICIVKNEDLHIERFMDDYNVWAMVKRKLTTFYFNFLLPEIIKND